MDLEEPPLAGDAMQVVDVLRDGGAEDAQLLELDQRQMPGVRVAPPASVVHSSRIGPGGIEPLLPRPARVTQEALVAVERRLAVLRPEAARTAERRDAALHRQPGAGQRDRVPCRDETRSGSLERLARDAVHAGYVLPPGARVNPDRRDV